MVRWSYCIVLFVLLAGCRDETPKQNHAVVDELIKVDSVAMAPETPEPLKPDYDTTQWFEMLAASNVQLDIRYATTNNFTKEIIYPCGRCFIHKKSADRFLAAMKVFEKKGYGVRFFDCYRPHPAQQKLWDIVPNPMYVADPKKGSMHNRGLAIDLTLYELATGEVLEMGAPFDFFGKRAYHDYTDLPKAVLDNRALLKGVLADHGFKHTRTEWWHYSDTKNWSDIATFEWTCK